MSDRSLEEAHGLPMLSRAVKGRPGPQARSGLRDQQDGWGRAHATSCLAGGRRRQGWWWNNPYNEHKAAVAPERPHRIAKSKCGYLNLIVGWVRNVLRETRSTKCRQEAK